MPERVTSDARSGAIAVLQRALDALLGEHTLSLLSVRDGWTGDHYARGWCRKHWHRWWKHGDPTHVERGGAPQVREGCRVDGCDGDHSARGLCNRHYQRWYAGDPDLQDVALEPVPYLAGEGQGEGSTPASNTQPAVKVDA